MICLKRLISVTTAAIIAASCCSFGVLAEKQKEDDIVILYTNDVHCGVTDYIGYDGLALYKREMEEEYEHVLLVDAGDSLQGGMIGTMTNGAYITELMNAVHYDVASLGNHEFDYSIPTLQQRADELDCGYICCNFRSLETNEFLFEPYKVIDFGETQVAFIGATTPDTLSGSKPVYFQNEDGEYIYSFGEHGTDLYDMIQENVDKVRNDGADYVILLGHLGETEVVERWSSLSVAENTEGIDVIVDGHSHETTPELIVKNKNGEEVRITQTGTKLQNIGKLTITPDGRINTELVDIVPEPDSDSGIGEDTWKKADDRQGRNVDAAVNNKINELQSDFDIITNTVIGHANFTLYDCDPETKERRVRNGETNLGDLVADSIRNHYGSDIGLINGGGLRASIPEGNITYGTMLDVLPFGNTLCSVKATGQQILDFLEFSSMLYPVESGSFLSVSGLEYTIDKDIESTVTVDDYGIFTGVSGEYRVKNVTVGGEPLDPGKTYTVASIDFLLKLGGDGYILTGKCESYKDDQALDIDVLSEYLTVDLGGAVPEEYRAPGGQGRIKITDQSESSEKSEESGQETSDPESSEPEVSEPESSGSENSKTQNSGSSVPDKQDPTVSHDENRDTETDTPKTGDAPTAAEAVTAVVLFVSSITALLYFRKKQDGSRKE